MTKEERMIERNRRKRETYLVNRERILEQRKAYAIANKAKIAAINKRFYTKNKVAIRQHSKQ